MKITMERRICVRSLLFLAVALLGAAEAKTKKNWVTEFVKKSGASIFGGKDQTQFAVLLESKESEDYDDHLDEFTKAARNFEDKVRFVYINTDVEENWQIIEFLGLLAEDVPGVLFIDLEKGLKKYKANINEIMKKEITEFVQKCLDGEVTPFLKSDEIPEDWDKGLVVELVGKNFEEQVFHTKKSTFVFFYAPWCAACQNTMPEVEKLGNIHREKKNVVIAKMNSINNEVPGLPVFDVPTIALFVKGSRNPIYYTENERTVNSFSQFITSNLKDAESKERSEPAVTPKESSKKAEKRDKKQTKEAEKKSKASKDEL